MEEERKKSSGLNRREQGGDGGSRKGCPEPDIRKALVQMSMSSDSDSEREKDAIISFCSEHLPMTVVEVRGRSTGREDMHEKWNEYARTGTATFIIAHWEGARDTGNGEVIVSSAEPFAEQGVEDMVRSPGEHAEPRRCRQRRRKNICTVSTIGVSLFVTN